MPPSGRPRSFDRDVALEQAMLVFWEHGYEPTSVARLTAAMGITPPSLYAAFGDKRSLFIEAIERYQATDGAYAGDAMANQPTARAAVEALLLGAAATFTAREHPRGCMVIEAATNCSAREASVQHELRTLRQRNEAALRARIAADVASGRLPSTTDAAALARLYGTVLQGMSAQARDGASRAELERVARDALLAWPR